MKALFTGMPTVDVKKAESLITNEEGRAILNIIVFNAGCAENRTIRQLNRFIFNRAKETIRQANCL